MVNDNASAKSAEPAKLPPPPKVVAPIAQPVPALAPPPPPVLSQVTGPNLPLPPPPPPTTPPAARDQPAQADRDKSQWPYPPPPQSMVSGGTIPPTLPVQVTGPPAAISPPPAETPAPPETRSEAAAPAGESPPVAEKKVREYRYRTRVIKAAILPILFSAMSFLMLNNYVTGYEPYFTYDLDIILAGFAVGTVVTTGFLLANMRVARRDGSYPSRQKNSIVIILAFLVPYVYLMMVVSLSLAWKFSIGYFFSALLTPIVVMVYESYARGKFYVQEEEEDDRLTRTLVFRA